MRIISERTIKIYYEAHPEEKAALQDRVAKVKEATWENRYDLKQTFDSVGYVGNRHYVFNIRVNLKELLNPGPCHGDT